MSIFQVESLAFQRHQIHSAIFVVTINQKFILYLYEDGTNERYVECDSLKHFLRAINARLKRSIPFSRYHDYDWYSINTLLSHTNLNRIGSLLQSLSTEPLDNVFAVPAHAVAPVVQPQVPVQEERPASDNQMLVQVMLDIQHRMFSLENALRSTAVSSKVHSSDEHYLVIFRSNTTSNKYYFFRVQYKCLATRIRDLQNDERFPDGLTLLRYFQTPNAVRFFNTLIDRFSNYLIRHDCCLVERRSDLWRERQMIENICVFYDSQNLTDSLPSPLERSDKVITPLQSNETRDYRAIYNSPDLLSH